MRDRRKVAPTGNRAYEIRWYSLSLVSFNPRPSGRPPLVFALRGDPWRQEIDTRIYAYQSVYLRTQGKSLFQCLQVLEISAKFIMYLRLLVSHEPNFPFISIQLSFFPFPLTWNPTSGDILGSWDTSNHGWWLQVNKCKIRVVSYIYIILGIEGSSSHTILY